MRNDYANTNTILTSFTIPISSSKSSKGFTFEWTTNMKFLLWELYRFEYLIAL